MAAAFGTINRLDLRSLRAIESLSRGPVAVPVHSHGEYHVTLVVDGACNESYLGRASRLGPFDVTSFLPGESHSLNVPGDSLTTFDLELETAWVENLVQAPLKKERLVFSRHEPAAQIVHRLYSEFRNSDDVSHLAIEGLALELLAALSRLASRHREPPQPMWLRTVLDMIRQQPGQTPGLLEMAQLAGVHPAYFGQVFKAHLNCTPGQFIRRLRIERAIRLMSNCDRTLAQIALDAGFADQSHLNRVFKRAVGVTPAEFRRQKYPGIVQATMRSSKTDLD